MPLGDSINKNQQNSKSKSNFKSNQKYINQDSNLKTEKFQSYQGRFE